LNKQGVSSIMRTTLLSKKKDDDQFGDEEAKRRFVAALRGARLAGHVPMKAKKTANKTKPKTKPAGEAGLPLSGPR
jgi:hypothetical protein